MSEGSILIVCEEPSVVRAAQVTLAAKGYEVANISSIEEVLRLKNPEQYDLLLLDSDTFPSSTASVCRQIRACGDMAIIVMSGDDSEETKTQAILAGADAYLPKPFGVAEMFTRVRANIRKTRLVTAPQALVS